MLQMCRMNEVREIDVATMTVTVEAGCILETLQQRVLDVGYLFPP